MGLFIIFLIILYLVLATLFIRIVRKKTSNKLYRQLAVAFVILLPSWDVLLGFIVYYPACLFVPKNVIYETAETEGIYYEGDASNFLLVLSDGRNFTTHARTDYEKGFKYSESKITQTGDDLEKHRIPPAVYLCEKIPLRPDESYKTPVDCKPVTSARSDYLVRTNIIAIGRAAIGTVHVYNRSTNKLMAEYRLAQRASSMSILGLPFFNWLRLADGSPEIVSCPEKSRFNYFQYDVLKPKR
jgi:hypothetical protein